MPRQLIVWIVKGVGGMVRMISDWTIEFGKIPADQWLILKSHLDTLSELPHDDNR